MKALFISGYCVAKKKVGAVHKWVLCCPKKKVGIVEIHTLSKKKKCIVLRRCSDAVYFDVPWCLVFSILSKKEVEWCY